MASNLRPLAKCAPAEQREKARRLFVRLRKAHFKSQMAAAEYLGRHKSTIEDWERGANAPDSGALAQLLELDDQKRVA